MMYGYEGQRRSARLSALEASRAHQTSSSRGGPEESIKRAEEDSDDDSEFSLPELPEKKRGRKRKLRPIEEVVVNSVETELQQISDIPNNVDHTSNNGQPSNPPPKRVLQLFLDVLKKRDSHGIFAEPVDPDEVVGYDKVIKEPMDFATMTAKLEEGMYTTLEQFENDVFLIASNAMHFNCSNTIFFRQARAIHELAKKMFHFLRNDPQNFEMEYAAGRRRPGRKPGDGLGSRGKVSVDVKPNGKAIDYASNDRPYPPSILRRNSRKCEIPSGFGGDRTNPSEADQRGGNKPWKSFLNENESLASKFVDRSEPLLIVNQGDIGYEESLTKFAKDLGPTAQMVASRKLKKLKDMSQQTHQMPPTSVQQRPIPTPPNNIINIPPSRNYLDKNSSGSGTSFNHNGTYGGEMVRQNPSSEIQLGSHIPIARVGNMNVPATGMGNSSNEYSAMNQTRRVELPSEFPQSGMLQYLVRNNNSSRLSPSPFQGMRAPICSHSSTSGPSYNVNSGQSSRISEWSQHPSLGSHSLEGQNQAMAAPAPSYGSGSNVLAQAVGWSQSNLNSLPACSHALEGQNQAMAVPAPSYGSGSNVLAQVVGWGQSNLNSLSVGSHSLEGQNQAMAARAPSYGSGSNVLAQVVGWNPSNLNSLSVGSHSLEGQNQAMAALAPSYGSGSNLLAQVMGWGQSNLNSLSVGRRNNAINAPSPSYIVNSTQTGLVPERSTPNFTSLFFNEDLTMGAPSQSYGVGSAQMGSQLRPCNTQNVYDMAFLEMRLREMNSVRPDVQRSLAPAEVPRFEPMGFYDSQRDTMHSHSQQGEQSTQALLDNQHPDLALQL